MSIAMIFDIILIALLVLVIMSATSLSKKLGTLRESRKALEQLAAQFDDATRRAEGGIKSLQSATGNMGEQLQHQLDKARSLRDELSIMIDSADSLARRLEAATPQSPKAGTAYSPAPDTTAAVAAAPDARSRAERELLSALKSQQGNPRS